MRLSDTDMILEELAKKFNKASIYDDLMSAGECDGLWTAINIIGGIKI